MAKFKATGVINLKKEGVRLTEGKEIEVTVKRADEINKVYREQYQDKDILVRLEDK